MLKKMFKSLPFISHQPPLTLPLRKAVLLSTKRPVQLNEIEIIVSIQFEKDFDSTLESLERGIGYLRKERFFKTDAANLFVAGLRSLAKYNQHEAIEFGFKMIHELPDLRAIRSMVTYLSRFQRYDDVLKLLNYTKNKKYASETREKTLSAMHPEMNEISNVGPPWMFSLEEPIKLTKKPQYFKHRFESMNRDDSEGLTPEYELFGRIKIAKFGKSSDALVSFLFMGPDNQILNPARIPGLTYSKTVGWYSYLRQNNQTGEFLIDFELVRIDASLI